MVFKNIDRVLIRYNTESDGKTLLWRLLIAGKEYLVNEIQVQKPCSTSTDWLQDKQVFKHHIAVQHCDVAITADSIAILTEPVNNEL